MTTQSKARKNEMITRKASAAENYPTGTTLTAYRCRVDGDGPGEIVYADCPNQAAEDYCEGGDWDENQDPVEVLVSWGPEWMESACCLVDVHTCLAI